MANKNDSYLEYIIDLISPFYEVSSRKMFGGYGLYINGKIFAIIAKQGLYFKGSSDRAKEFFSNKTIAFGYEKNNKQVTMFYWAVPEEVLEDSGCLKKWLDISLL